ncbi:hypothetical protein OSB04_006980 [Centaurea solstitialis]|uniref:DUF4218 domain-containing protein n=1 Tax=Centaurea solstitialis TaxID=347529 RepID=A0AA38TVP8_9ASTR|nr:hypothetical protein OSB04_006980 [Centaurea solstitialis]
MSKYTADHMRYHGQREMFAHDDVLRHPADGETWKDFDRSYLQFASDIRNVRIGLSTDGFSPFGASATPYSLWPIVFFGRLVFGHGIDNGEEYFMMKVAVMWIISDFPRLKTLSGIQTKRYKACPICLDDTDAKFSHGRMSYIGERRWLDINHEFRVYKKTVSHQYPRLSLVKEKKSSQKSRVRHALDVMHIEKNVCDNILCIILGFDGKSKDDLKARKLLEDMKIRKHLWPKKTRATLGKTTMPYANYTVKPQFRLEVLDQIVAVQYPSDYAGSLKNKVNINNKKFYGLKTHDCHVLLQRVLPVMLCARELKKSDVEQMQKDIILVLCKFEAIFPQAFFTIMVHLCIHLPEQVFLNGPVHYTWMFPIESVSIFMQLGEYKKHVTNTRYPEGCIAERYLMHECVMFMNLYLKNVPAIHNNTSNPNLSRWSFSVVSDYVVSNSRIWNATLTKEKMETARWMVIINCSKAQPIIDEFNELYVTNYPKGCLEHRIATFHQTFKIWVYIFTTTFKTWVNTNYVFSPFICFIMQMADEQRNVQQELVILSRSPQQTGVYQQCNVNGVRFVCEQQDECHKTQNSGVMIVADGVSYYGVLLEVIELSYLQCRSFCLSVGATTKKIQSQIVNNCYKDNKFCLALHAKQVFYINDPMFGNGWKVVHHMFHRGTYKASTLARNTDVGPRYEVEEPYQEPVTTTIPICQIFIDIGPTPRIDISDDDDDNDEDCEEEDEDNEFDSDDEEEEENDVLGINDGTDSDNDFSSEALAPPQPDESEDALSVSARSIHHLYDPCLSLIVLDVRNLVNDQPLSYPFVDVQKGAVTEASDFPETQESPFLLPLGHVNDSMLRIDFLLTAFNGHQ